MTKYPILTDEQLDSIVTMLGKMSPNFYAVKALKTQVNFQRFRYDMLRNRTAKEKYIHEVLKRVQKAYNEVLELIVGKGLEYGLGDFAIVNLSATTTASDLIHALDTIRFKSESFKAVFNPNRKKSMRAGELFKSTAVYEDIDGVQVLTTAGIENATLKTFNGSRVELFFNNYMRALSHRGMRKTLALISDLSAAEFVKIETMMKGHSDYDIVFTLPFMYDEKVLQDDLLYSSLLPFVDAVKKSRHRMTAKELNEVRLSYKARKKELQKIMKKAKKGVTHIKKDEL